MTYALIANNQIVEYPLYEGDIRLKHNNISFPVPFVPPEGYVIVEETPFPHLEYNQYMEESQPIKVDGVWRKNWVVKTLPQEDLDKKIEEEWKSLRMYRNRLLAQSDWTQLADSQVDKAAWATYRQLLRDIPDTVSLPFFVVWPTPPSA